MNRSVFLPWMFLAIAPLSVTSVQAISIRAGVPVEDFFAVAAQYPAVGRLDDRGSAHCTATLVTPTKILTAAHCVDRNANNAPDLNLRGAAFLLGEDADSADSIHMLSSIAVNNRGFDEVEDIAVITLSEPVTSVVPMNIYDRPVVGQTITMVGYGESGTGARFPGGFDGLRRAALNILDVVGDTLETDFDQPSGTRSTYGDNFPLALEGTTAGGDSGGPLIADVNGAPFILGTVSYGFNPFDEFSPSEYGDISVFTNLDLQANRDFLIAQGLRFGGDFVPDEIYDAQDLDLLTTAIVSGNTSATAGLDLNSDGQVDAADVEYWLDLAGEINGTTYRLGDANLDGVVDNEDFDAWNGARFSATSNWSEGDWNLDGIADISDFNIWHVGKTTANVGVAVPEPAGRWVLLIGLIYALCGDSRRFGRQNRVNETPSRL